MKNHWLEQKEKRLAKLQEPQYKEFDDRLLCLREKWISGPRPDTVDHPTLKEIDKCFCELIDRTLGDPAYPSFSEFRNKIGLALRIFITLCQGWSNFAVKRKRFRGYLTASFRWLSN